MATSAGWDGTLNAIFDDTDCKKPDAEIGNLSKLVQTKWSHSKKVNKRILDNVNKEVNHIELLLHLQEVLKFPSLN